MQIDQFNPREFMTTYQRKLYNAIRRGLYKSAPDVVQQFREDGLDGSGPKRKKSISFKVRKNNTLAFIDNGFDARVREYGDTIRGGSKMLKVVVDPEYRERLRRDTAKGRSQDMFVTKGQDKAFLMQRLGEDEVKLVAVLKKQIRRDPIPEGDRLSHVASSNLAHIKAAVKRELDRIGEVQWQTP
ncbi:hypothetical protein [Paracoccus sp. SSK6]|uniref:hypothetical protein n=1 Tax=Paracoccus sp. SSK6 TaxID=3143131 RepID=UPI003219BD08